jgi:DNA-damage-inducible protein J
MVSQATALLRARVPAKRLKNAEKIFHRIGLTPGEAVNAFLAQVEINRGLPFPMMAEPTSRPNAETLAAIAAAERGEVETFNSVDDFMADLGK